MKQKLSFFIAIGLLISHFSFSQKDCQKEFTSGDVLRWRGELKFIPKYMTTEKIDYIINSLSDRAFQQMHIDVYVKCGTESEKKSTISNMVYFWDNKISQEQISTYFPAYFVFYQLDRAAWQNSKGNVKLNPSESPSINKENKKGIINHFELGELFNTQIIGKSFNDLKNTSNKTFELTTNSGGDKIAYWTDMGITVAFNFSSDQRSCKYFRVIPETDQVKNIVIDYLKSNLISTGEQKWYNNKHSYFVQLIDDNRDVFICFKNLSDV